MKLTQKRGKPDTVTGSATAQLPAQALRQVLHFLSEIGLPWEWAPGAAGFIPNVDIRDGVLLIDPGAKASAVLHEAGHLAILPGEFRERAGSNVDGVVRIMFQELAGEDPDSPRVRAALQCSDPEATAWAWAAGLACGLAPERIIEDEEYDGSGAGLRQHLACAGWIGIHGLSHAGFCVTRPGRLEQIRGLPAYPRLGMWLQHRFDVPARQEVDRPSMPGCRQS